MRYKVRLSYNQLSVVFRQNVKTVWEKCVRFDLQAIKSRNRDNRKLPRRAREHLSRQFTRLIEHYRSCVNAYIFQHGNWRVFLKTLIGLPILPSDIVGKSAEPSEEEPP